MIQTKLETSATIHVLGNILRERTLSLQKLLSTLVERSGACEDIRNPSLLAVIFSSPFLWIVFVSLTLQFALLKPSPPLQQPGTGEGSVDFSVVIAASAPAANVGLVHAVTVIQPAQTWTVIRSQGDFISVAEQLSAQIMDLPALPDAARQFQSSETGADDLQLILAARTHLQHWLETILMYPGARDSPAMRNFLTLLPNMIPSEYENVSWTIFTADGQVANTAPAAQGNPPDEGNLDDMGMDEMFDTNDDGQIDHDDDDVDSDIDEEYRASERYKACDEDITAEDEMDLAQVYAGDVEMVDDVGSLAQSLGASHLGRSLMLQDEHMGNNIGIQRQQQQGIYQGGLQLGSSMSGGIGGGIGSAMQQAPTQQIGSSFHQVKPDSPPRLEAFKMIKVIGKGSFGKYD